MKKKPAKLLREETKIKKNKDESIQKQTKLTITFDENIVIEDDEEIKKQ